MRKRGIPTTISNVKISSHDLNIINVSFSILKILWSWLRRVQIYVNQKVNGSVIKEINTWNISIVKNVFP